MEDAKSIDAQSEKPSQTFIGWDSDSMARMAYGRGERFPAILTYKSAVDKDVLNLLRAVMNRGVRPETFSDILKELHSIKYFGEMIDREWRDFCTQRELVFQFFRPKEVQWCDPDGSIFPATVCEFQQGHWRLHVKRSKEMACHWALCRYYLLHYQNLGQVSWSKDVLGTFESSHMSTAKATMSAGLFWRVLLSHNRSSDILYQG
jgi:hypothetical protein